MAELLKNVYFTKPRIEHLARRLAAAYGDFDEDAFIRAVFDKHWKHKELKSRMRHVTERMHAALPRDYPRALKILAKVAPHIGDFDGMIFPEYVELYGRGDWERSLPALRDFTRYSSSEFAIRPFLIEDRQRALKFLRECARDKNEHVRRFASEGCRPRLPWAMALPELKKDPRPLLAILKALKDDPSEYVRKSVANNINDISKDHPDFILDLCESWVGKSERTDWIVKHGLRGLLKKADRRAMALFGFGDTNSAVVQKLRISPKNVKIGGRVDISFELVVKRAGRLRLEYAVHYRKQNGKVSKKVFQIGEKEYAKGSYQIEKRHSFEDRSTRKHVPGKHEMEVLVNGVVRARGECGLK